MGEAGRSTGVHARAALVQVTSRTAATMTIEPIVGPPEKLAHLGENVLDFLSRAPKGWSPAIRGASALTFAACTEERTSYA